MAATGNPQGGMGIGSHLSSRYGEEYSKVYRVLNRHGEISPGWKAASPNYQPQLKQSEHSSKAKASRHRRPRLSKQRFDAKTWLASRPSALPVAEPPRPHGLGPAHENRNSSKPSASACGPHDHELAFRIRAHGRSR